MAIGRVHDAPPAARRAMERGPFSPVYAIGAAEQLAYGGRLGEARRILTQARERWPHEPMSEFSRLEIEAREGDPAAARAILGDPAYSLAACRARAWRAGRR